MLIKAPLFVNGFQRGGTSILVGMLLSHPDVFALGETHHVVYGRPRAPRAIRWVKRAAYVPIVLATGQHFFGPRSLAPRRALPAVLQRYLDLLLYRAMARDVGRARRVSAANPNGRSARLRPTLKNVNGMVLTTPLLARMYPDATFFGLVRHGLAVCEGFVRRGWAAQDFARLYARVCQQMIDDAARLENYHLLRFEDLILDPARTIEHAYRAARLDFDPRRLFCLPAKPSLDGQGQHRLTFEAHGDAGWFGLDELSRRLRQDVNANQIRRLGDRDAEAVRALARPQMEHFGYC